MKSVVLIAIFLIGAANAVDERNAAEVKIEVVESIEKYLLENPNVNVTELTLNSNARLNQNWYTLGSRVSGDRLIAIDSNWAQYPSKNNLELKITYPASGVGAVVTHIQIMITQDNGTYGRGYVTAGGIGQRYIQVIVEAWNTAFIRYDYSFYGV